jgi:hypothetical protein
LGYISRTPKQPLRNRPAKPWQIFDVISFAWIRRVIKLARLRPLHEPDLTELHSYDCAQASYNHFLKYHRKGSSVLSTLFRCHAFDYSFIGFWRLSKSFFQFVASAYCLPRVLDIISNNGSIEDGIYWSLGLFAATCLQIISHHQYFYQAYR